MQGSTECAPLISETDHANALNASASHDFTPRGAAGMYVRYVRYVRPVLAELTGTLLFVCLGVLCVQYASLQGPGFASGAVCIAMGHGLAIAVMVTAFGEISGGHFNPAVSLGVALAGGISPKMAACYVLAQLTGGILGAGLSRAILPYEVYKAIGGGAHTLGSGVMAGQGVLCEVVLTTVLVLTILHSAVDPRTKSSLAPLAIGFAVLVDILAGMPVTGASMNPARSFGPAVVVSSLTSDYWTYHYIYWVGPFLGSLVAAFLYRLFLASDDRRLVFKS